MHLQSQIARGYQFGYVDLNEPATGVIRTLQVTRSFRSSTIG